MTDVQDMPRHESDHAGERERVAKVLRARAEVLARPLADVQSESTVDLVTLNLDGFSYAIEATLVREVYAVREITPLPTAPEFVLGITNIRGKIIAVLDLSAVLGHGAAGKASGRTIVVEIDGIEIGVDARECGVARVPHRRLRPPSRTGGAPRAATAERDRYLKLVGGEDLGVLDLERIIADTRRTAAPLEARPNR